MTTTTAAILACAAILIMVVGGAIILLRMHGIMFSLFGGRRAQGESREPWLHRLLHPQWRDLERHYGRPISSALKQLYANASLIQMEDFFLIDPNDKNHDEWTWHIDRFSPADLQALESRWDCLDSHLYEFAHDSMGNPFLVRITDDPNDPLPVYFWMHDGGSDPEFVTASPSEFLRWQKRSSSLP